jgi:hypothetical protein
MRSTGAGAGMLKGGPATWKGMQPCARDGRSTSGWHGAEALNSFTALREMLGGGCGCGLTCGSGAGAYGWERTLPHPLRTAAVAIARQLAGFCGRLGLVRTTEDRGVA